MPKITPRQSADLLSDTPMKTESISNRRRREDEHRAIPQEEQPFMVCYMGMLDYGVLWIGPRNGSEEVAEEEAQWWREKIERGLEILPFSRRPEAHMVMVRQQWDLDALTKAIHDSYEQQERSRY